MINIVVPMAGRGSRFLKAGYQVPKPLIEINGKPMIDIVINNIAPQEKHTFIFLVLKEHLERYSLEKHLETVAPDCKIITVEEVTEGAACTVLLAKKWIENEDPLMIANCDQYIDTDINDYLTVMKQKQSDGLVMTMKADDPKWSFIKYGGDGTIEEIIEKKVVSQDATVGIYNFSHGIDFVKAAEAMIKKNLRVNNEFYVAPVYNLLLKKGYRISTYNIGSVSDGMYGLGTPEDLQKFLETDIYKKATDF